MSIDHPLFNRICIIFTFINISQIHTHRFNGHCPGEPGLAGCPLDNRWCWR